MKRSVILVAGGACAALAIFFACDTVSTPSGGTSPVGTSRFVDVESEFSQDEVSPGGTGGTVGSNIEGSDDVVLAAEETRSFFTAFQIDPEAEDSAGPKFVVAGDVDQDGWLDLVSAWNQSQPVQLHLQRRDPEGKISFRTITLAGTSPIAIVAGLALGQINGDGWLDVVVLVKGTGAVTLCPVTDPPSETSRTEGEIVVLFNPGSATALVDGDQWSEILLVNPLFVMSGSTTSSRATRIELSSRRRSVPSIRASPPWQLVNWMARRETRLSWP